MRHQQTHNQVKRQSRDEKVVVQIVGDGKKYIDSYKHAPAEHLEEPVFGNPADYTLHNIQMYPTHLM
jgi:hypothetical protein